MPAGRRAGSRWIVDGDVVAVGPVGVVEAEGHPPPVLSVAVGDHLVVTRQFERVHPGDADQADHREVALVDLAPDLRPLALERRGGPVAAERPAQRRPRPEPDRQDEPVERLHLAADDRAEARRAVRRRRPVGRRFDARLEQVADRVAHPAAEAGRGVADPDDPRIERAEPDRRARREAVREMEAVGAGQEARDDALAHVVSLARVRLPGIGAADRERLVGLEPGLHRRRDGGRLGLDPASARRPRRSGASRPA